MIIKLNQNRIEFEFNSIGSKFIQSIWIKFRILNLMQFNLGIKIAINSIQVACNVIFSFELNLIFTKSIQFFQ